MTMYAGSHGEPYRKGGPPQKRKGNPVITRYPPPPGYRQPTYPPPYQQGPGPSPTHPPYTPNQHPQYQAQGPYQHPQTPYQQPPGPYQHAPSQYHQQQGSYPYQSGSYPQAQGGYPVAQGGYQYPQNAYQQPPYGQAPAPYQHPSAHPHHRNSGSYDHTAAVSPQYPAHNAYPNHAAGSPSHAPHHGYGGYPPTPAPQYGQPPANGYHHPPNNDYAPSVQHHHPQQGPRGGHEYTNGNHGPSSWQAEPQSNDPPASTYEGPPPDVDEEPPPRRLPKAEKLVYMLEDDHQYWDQESGSGALWPKAGDYVNPRTSIGVQIWRAPHQVARALPSSWAAAERQPDGEPSLGNGESVSEYFGPDNAYEARLDIRQTDHWKDVEDWPEFQPVDISGQVVSLDMVRSLRDRPDVEVVEEEKKVSPEPVLASSLGKEEDQDEWNVMDTLDKALDPSRPVAEPDESQKTPTPNNERHDSNEKTPTGPSASSRPYHPPSHAEPQRTRSYSGRPQQSKARNPSQEEILARLGVTGDPKPKTQEKFRRASGGQGVPPPPPPPPAPEKRSPSLDPWTTNGYSTKARSASVHSAGSHHTLAGSDFNPDSKTEAMDTHNDAPPTSPGAKHESPLSRKRSRGGDQYTSGAFDAGHYSQERSNDGGRQPDDGGRRKRPKPNNRSYTNPYGRR